MINPISESATLSSSLELLKHQAGYRARCELGALVGELTPAERATCPSCGGTQIQIVNLEKKSIAAALLIEWVTESTAAGVAAASRRVTCNKCVACGTEWVPGTPVEALQRLFANQFGEDQRHRIIAELNRGLQEKAESDQKRTRTTLIAGVLIFAAIAGLVVLVTSSNRAQERKSSQAWMACAQAKEPGQEKECGYAPTLQVGDWVNCILSKDRGRERPCGVPPAGLALKDWLAGHEEVRSDPRTSPRLDSLVNYRPDLRLGW